MGSTKASEKRIGAGRRRAPGDVVAGALPNGDEFIGRIVRARRGAVEVRLDNGLTISFAAQAAARELRTIEECDAPCRRTAYGTWVLDETAVTS